MSEAEKFNRRNGDPINGGVQDKSDPTQIARGIATEFLIDLFDNLHEDCDLHIDMLTKVIREYGEAEYLRGIQHHFKTCDEREKQADTAGYRRGVEEVLHILKTNKKITNVLDMAVEISDLLQRVQEGGK